MGEERVTIILEGEDTLTPAFNSAAKSGQRFQEVVGAGKVGVKDLTEATKVLSPQIGEMSDKLLKVGASLAKLTGPAGMLLGATAGFAAMGAATVVAWRAMRDMILAADEQREKLRALGLITAEQAKKIEAAAVASRTLTLTTETLTARLAAAAADGWGNFTLGVSAAAMVLARVPWEQVKADLRAIHEEASKVGSIFTGDFSRVGDLSIVKKGIAEFDAATKKRKEEEEKRRAAAKAAEDARFAAVEKQNDAIGAMGRAEQERILATREAEQAAHEERLAQVMEIAEAEKRAQEERTEAGRRALEIEQGNLAAIAEAREANERAGLALGLDVAAQLSDALFAGAEQSKATALAQIAIQTALAVGQAIATLPAPAWPVGIAAALATGGIQAGVIAGTSIPKRHIGGTVPESGPRPPGGRPGERSITALAGERVLTANQYDELRGGGGTTVLVQLGDKLFDAATGRAVRRTGSPLNQAQIKGRAGQLRFR